MKRVSTCLPLEEIETLERNGELGYRVPDNDTLLKLADSQVHDPGVSLSPDRKWMLLCSSPKFTPLSFMAANEVSVAGIRIFTQQFNKSTGRSYNDSFKLINISEIRKEADSLTSEQQTLPKEPQAKNIEGIPENSLMRSLKWSPDSEFFSFLLVDEKEVQFWVANVISATAKKVTGSINASLAVSSYKWKNTREIIFLRATNKEKTIPVAPIPPFSPSIRSNLSGNVATARTYQNLLKTAHDEDLFRFFTSSDICVVKIDDQGNNQSEETLTKTEIFNSIMVSPDGKYLLSLSYKEPFSYLVPYYRFPSVYQVWDLTQSPPVVVFNKEKPLQEQVAPLHNAVSAGPREMGWISSSQNSLHWLEAQDGGDPTKDVEIRDILFSLSAPFNGEPNPLFSFSSRFYDADWTHHGFAWVEERWWKTRWTKVHKICLNDKFEATESLLMFERSYEDKYNSPGSIWISKDKTGHFVAPVSNNNEILLESAGASPKGYLPFLDRFNTQLKTSQRLWRCAEGYYERVQLILENDGSSFITKRQTNQEQPNFWLYKQEKNGEFKSVQITNFPNPYYWMDSIKQEIVTYKRADGTLLSGKLYLPQGFKPGVDEPLPMLLWAYPEEFTTQEAANQVKATSSTFTSIYSTSPIYWVTQGFAILSRASMPIIAKKDANDEFIPQLISNAETHVDEMIKQKIADPNRIAVGGHSYGAFMVANLLAHTNLFCAGIARSGAYNRTLTPFGFQNEERTLWESADLYYQLSPFNQAHKIKSPLLLIHGENDCNSGTHLDQSIRFYNALKANGCVTRLVVLPFEGHSYKARENILQLLWESDFWLNSFVKNRKTPNDSSQTD